MTPAEGGKLAVDGDIFFRSDHERRGAGLDSGTGRGALASVGETAGVESAGAASGSVLTVTEDGPAGADGGGGGGGGGAGMVKPLGPEGIGLSLRGPVGASSPRGPMGKRPPCPCIGTGMGMGKTRLTSAATAGLGGGTGASRLKLPRGAEANGRTGGGEGDRGRLRGDRSRSLLSGLSRREERHDDVVEGERDDRRERGGGDREAFRL